jgi:hypothetical protein
MDASNARLARLGSLLVAGLVTAGAAVAGPAGAAQPSCGRPDEAPGFGTPARDGVVPDMNCMDLRLAESKAAAAGYNNLSSQDATGRGRRQYVGRNWVVVAQTPAPGTKAKSATRLTFKVLYYGDPGAPPVPDRNRPGPVPRLACFDLQEAQDTLQSAGFTRMGNEDASGRGRHPIIDRHWTVTGQDPAPGGVRPKSTKITLRS